MHTPAAAAVSQSVPVVEICSFLACWTTFPVPRVHCKHCAPSTFSDPPCTAANANN